MYGNNYRPFIMPRNNLYMPYNTIPRPLFNVGGIKNIFRGVNNLNWQGMLNNVYRTLGVVREAIPVVKEVGPMINNMRSMIKIASVFKDETDTKKSPKKSNTSREEETNNTSTSNTPNYNYNNEPNFFL